MDRWQNSLIEEGKYSDQVQNCSTAYGTLTCNMLDIETTKKDKLEVAKAISQALAMELASIIVVIAADKRGIDLEENVSSDVLESIQHTRKVIYGQISKFIADATGEVEK